MTWTVKAYMGWKHGWVVVKVCSTPAEADDYIMDRCRNCGEDCRDYNVICK